MLSFGRIKEVGEYLGFCKQKGFIYSVPIHSDFSKKEEYYVVAIRKGEIEVLIYHAVEKEDKDV